MNAIDHQVQLEQQITAAYRRACDASLDGRRDEAKLAIEQMDRLLDRLPRPRIAEHDTDTPP